MQVYLSENVFLGLILSAIEVYKRMLRPASGAAYQREIHY